MSGTGRRSAFTVVGIVVCAAALAGCASAPVKTGKRTGGSSVEVGTRAVYGVDPSERVIEDGRPIPQGGGRDQVGRPYRIAGKWYTPKEDPAYDRVGVASWYGAGFHGRKTANGEIYDKMRVSAAHTTMPLPSYARVTNVANGRSIMVRVNDRGPYHDNRIIDLSERVADELGFKGHGLARVRVQYVGRAPLDGSDQRMLMASLRDGPGEGQIRADRAVLASTYGPGYSPDTATPRGAIAVARLEPTPPPRSAVTQPRPVQVAAVEPVGFAGGVRAVEPPSTRAPSASLPPVSAAVAAAPAVLPPLPKPVSSSGAIAMRDAPPATGGPLVLLPPGAMASVSTPGAALPPARPAPGTVTSSLPNAPAVASRPLNPTGTWALAPLPPLPATVASTPQAPSAIAPVRAPRADGVGQPILTWQPGPPPVERASTASRAQPAPVAVGAPIALMPPIRATQPTFYTADQRVSAGHEAIERALASADADPIGALIGALERQQAVTR